MPRPVSILEKLQDLTGQPGWGSRQAERVFLDQVSRERRDVVASSFPQWGQVHLDDAESMVEIATERALIDPCGEVLDRGGQESDVEWTGSRRTERTDLVRLDHTEEFRLSARRETHHSVEKESAAPHVFEETDSGFVGAGERARDVSEQLGFEELRR